MNIITKIAGLGALTCSALFFTGCTIEELEKGRMPDVDVKVDPGKLPKYDVDGPDVDIKNKEVDVTVPDVDVHKKKVEVTVPDIDVKGKKTTVTVPDIDVKLPGDKDYKDDDKR